MFVELIAQTAPLESLKPYAKRIYALASTAQSRSSMTLLLGTVGAFDIDPTELLRSALKSTNPHIRYAAAAGVCRAEEKWGRVVAPDLRGLLSVVDFNTTPAFDILEAARGLKRWGLDSAIDEFLRKVSSDQVSRFKYDLSLPEGPFARDAPC